MGKLKNALTKARNLLRQWRKRRRLRHTDFSIIANNCWAGFAYQEYGLPYNTPTIGLFITDIDYIKFLERLDYYLSLPLEFVTPRAVPGYSASRKLYDKEIIYPIGRLDDIYIWFMHYASPEEARTKWERRKKRINHGRLLVKWSQRYGNDPELMHRFLALPFKNKIAFVEPAAAIDDPRVIVVPELERLNREGGDETDYTLRQIDILSLLNSIE